MIIKRLGMTKLIIRALFWLLLVISLIMGMILMVLEISFLGGKNIITIEPRFYSYENDHNMKNKNDGGHLFYCGNIHQIEIVQRNIGCGFSKCADIGVYQGKKIVIKTLGKSKTKDINYRQSLFLKEILLSEQLEHPNIIKLLGYCVRNLHSNTNGRFLQKAGISAVYEFGEGFDIQNLTFSVNDRLRHALELASLIVYFHKSPLGSLIMGDFSPHHFLMVSNSIKLIDLDYVHNIEPTCDENKENCFDGITKCVPNVEATTMSNCTQDNKCYRGVCKGYNERNNIQLIYQTFLMFLLQPEFFPEKLRIDIKVLNDNLKLQRIDSGDLYTKLQNLIDRNNFIEKNYVD